MIRQLIDARFGRIVKKMMNPGLTPVTRQPNLKSGRVVYKKSRRLLQLEKRPAGKVKS